MNNIQEEIELVGENARALMLMLPVILLNVLPYFLIFL